MGFNHQDQASQRRRGRSVPAEASNGTVPELKLTSASRALCISIQGGSFAAPACNPDVGRHHSFRYLLKHLAVTIYPWSLNSPPTLQRVLHAVVLPAGPDSGFSSS